MPACRRQVCGICGRQGEVWAKRCLHFLMGHITRDLAICGRDKIERNGQYREFVHETVWDNMRFEPAGQGVEKDKFYEQNICSIHNRKNKIFFICF